MNRREFLKICGLITMGLLYGCKKTSFLDSQIKKIKAIPSIKDFEAEVRRAIIQSKSSIEWVKIPMPQSIKNNQYLKNNDSLNYRFGMSIDLDLCNGCGKCILACNIENNIPLVTEDEAIKNRFMHWIKIQGGYPIMCMHCGNAPCEKVCPTGAANHSIDGLSVMMYKRCTGTRFCGANCPIGARKFNYNDASSLSLSRKFNDEVPLRGKGVMEKCSMCIQRIQNDRLKFKTNSYEQNWDASSVKTACSEACPKNAILFGNWLDKNSQLVKIAKERELYVPKGMESLDPSVVYMRGKR